jgi:hypothetical protein
MSPFLRRFCIAVLAFILLLLLPPMLQALVIRLPLGWIGFLARVGPEIKFSGAAVGMGVFCSVLIICGIQWLGSGLKRQLPNASGQPWRWGWSVSLYLSVWLLFFASMGITGFTHQLAWLLRSNEELYVKRESFYDWTFALEEQATILSVAAGNAGWTGNATRSAYFADRTNSRFHKNALDEFHVVFLSDKNDQFVAAFIFHRDEGKRARAGFITVTPERTSEVRPFTEFNSALDQYTTGTRFKSAL